MKFRSLPPRIKISDLTDISVLGFYGYISEYFYINIDNVEIKKNTLKFLEIPYKN